jgi:hypothetical protein
MAETWLAEYVCWPNVVFWHAYEKEHKVYDLCMYTQYLVKTKSVIPEEPWMLDMFRDEDNQKSCQDLRRPMFLAAMYREDPK